MGEGLESPGSARLMLSDTVVHLDPMPAVFEAMLEVWSRQQRARFLNEQATVAPRMRLVRRFAEFTNSYPWPWEPADAEAFIVAMRSQVGRRPVAVSTARGYEMAISLFMEFVTDRRYGWAELCWDRFGQVPQQVFHDGNSVVHVTDFEGRPGRRPLTYDEVQALFDAADARAELVRSQGRKGVLAALRDAALLKCVYAYGLRRAEVRGLDLADRRHAPKLPQYGRGVRLPGAVRLRAGRASLRLDHRDLHRGLR